MFKELDTKQKAPDREMSTLEYWRAQGIFEKTLATRQKAEEWVFYEGPPTANGRPGVHHVQARAYKDLFPRYKTMRGFLVRRKAGWDCHGLPVELEVEKRLGFTEKADIEKYGVEPFNKLCRESVMEYEQAWREMTERIGFWVDLDNAYMTMSNDFVESVWWSLKELWNKGLLYKGYKVVPFCAKDGTPLSSHEVSQGYRNVVDPSIFVRFPVTNPEAYDLPPEASLLVWTTTPWTLPGNVAAAVSPSLHYVLVDSEQGPVVICESLVEKVLGEGSKPTGDWKKSGKELVGLTYQAPFPLIPLERPGHRVVTGSFVSAEDGTGIVHLAPAFGADDMDMAREHDLPVILPVGSDGKFTSQIEFLSGAWFKDADKMVVRDLKERKLLLKKLDYEHSYPHCWRCRNPLMYFATESWFIKNTSVKERLIEKNETLDWHPDHIKHGRYGDWLNNLVDWALSRNRYWGTPLPVWECSCGHRDCLGSFQELAERSSIPLDPTSADFDPHRPYVDEIILECGECGGEMRRVPEVIDCWYDSGSMPFAQLHYPFENKQAFEKGFPADFICEGLDQTRGWFNSLHQLGVMLFDSVAYKSVICHGLVLDANGEKMSKSRGNVVDPWSVLNSEGADALRWYLYVSAPPELSRRFSVELVNESARRFLGTILNTYNFFVLNANAAKPDLSKAAPARDRDPLDRWVLARLNQLILEVGEDLDGFELTPAARKLDAFVDDLSNWFVRRSRRRFWSEEVDAFQSLWECLEVLSKLLAPFVPFIAETLYQGLHPGGAPCPSVHLEDWPQADPELIDQALLQSTEVLQKVVSLGRAARSESGHRTRQPLPEVLVRVQSLEQQKSLQAMAEQLSEELNVKSVRFLGVEEEFLDFELKPNLPVVGRKYGKLVPALKEALKSADGKAAAAAAAEGRTFGVEVQGQTLELGPDELLIEARSPEGYAAAEDSGYLVALSTELTPELEREGLARDLVRHVQELRKSSGLEITDRIHLFVEGDSDMLSQTLKEHGDTISSETLALQLSNGSQVPDGVPHKADVELKVLDLHFSIGLKKVVT
ncbi:MAG: isoleucine--tRNA ligase [Vulcanimicrobiota bacterium]